MLIDGSPLEEPAPPLNDLLARRAGGARPTRSRSSRPSDRLTWRELDEASAALAGGYRGLGLRARRPDRLADAEPDRPRRPLPRLLQGRAWSRRRSTTATRTARSTTRSRSAAPRRCSPTPSAARTSPRAAGSPASSSSGTIAYGGDEPTAERRASRRCSTASRPAAAPGARPVEPGRDLLHLGQHRPGQGRHPHARVAALDDRQRRRRLRARRRATSSCPAPRCRTSAPSSGRSARSRSAAGSSSPAPSTATSCCRCCASTSRPCWR